MLEGVLKEDGGRHRPAGRIGVSILGMLEGVKSVVDFLKMSLDVKEFQSLVCWRVLKGQGCLETIKRLQRFNPWYVEGVSFCVRSGLRSTQRVSILGMLEVLKAVFSASARYSVGCFNPWYVGGC